MSSTMNLSRRGIWMNEMAHPGTAINTVGFRIRYPKHPADVVSRAVLLALKDIDTLSLCITQENGSPELVPGGPEVTCPVLEEVTLAEAQAEWMRLSEEPMGMRMSRIFVRPITEGGAFLTLLLHHVLVDGRAMCVIAQRITDALAGFRLAPIPKTSYTKAEEQQDPFWVEYFADVNAEPALQHGTPKGLKRSWYRITLDKGFSDEIDRYASANGLTAASVFSGALSLYLSRAARTRDAVFLMPRMDRTSPAEREAVDCCTLVVPVRVTVDRRLSFSELCRTALQQGRYASAHKHYGMERILGDLRNAGLCNGVPSEYVLNFYRTRYDANVPSEIEMSMDGAMHNHLTLNITHFGSGYELLYDAREGVYDADRVSWLHDSLMGILKRGLSSQDAVGSFELLGEAERARLEQVRGREYPIDPNATIPSLFRDAVARFAEKPALYAGDAAYTYRELDAASNRVAHALIEKGIHGGDFVMFKLRRDHRLIPAMLGILKSGAAFIPIDPAYPADRIEYIQENSGAGAMIVDAEQLSTETAGCMLLDVDVLLAHPDSSDPFTVIPQEQAAYSIYTSGTTGRPKGVLLSHRGIVNITAPDNNPFNREIMRCGRGIVATGSVCFDISLFEFFVPLLNGMFIELAPEKAMADASALAELIQRHGANLIHCTPSRIIAYLRNARFADALSGIDAILSAGEALPGSLVDTMRDTYNVRMFNGYGPTETTIGATVSEAGDNKTIGGPIGNMGILVLDGDGRQVPFGVIGELCVYGAGVGIGYRNLPEMTAERFVTRCGRRVYRTGDLGVVLDDNRIAYFGRNDSQVKIRGLRIELPEIESSMLAYPGVAGACVQVRNLQGSEHLVGFYSVHDGASVEKKPLTEFLKGRLTFYMVPDILKELDAIPQTPGGKTDQRAVSRIPVEYERVYRAPENPFQIAICDAIAATLGQERVGLDDNFFTIGGDSLHTAELICEIEARLPGVKLEFEDVMKYPIPEQLALYLYRGSKAQPKQDDPLAMLDYTGIPERMAANVIGGDTGTHRLGNVLIAGATGFLGTHVLVELIRRKDLCDKIYCVVRPNRRQTSEKRLRSTLFYYEETDFSEELGSRVIAINGDIMDERISEALDGVHIDTVFNCAALVAHFAFDDKLERINVGAVKALLGFCEKRGASLVHVSTISVCGMYRRDTACIPTYTEKDLYLGQEIKGQYILTKYRGEYAALRSKVPVKLMRVGNLQGRISNGEFQINRKTNAFTRRLTSYVRLGMVPESLYRASVNFSPVDDVARMIVALASTDPRYTAFHVYPEKEVPFKALFDMLERLGHPVRVLSDEAFEAETARLRTTKQGLSMLEGILLERPDEEHTDTPITAEFTQWLLEALGQRWNEVTDEYLERYFTALEGLDMFSEEDE